MLVLVRLKRCENRCNLLLVDLASRVKVNKQPKSGGHSIKPSENLAKNKEPATATNGFVTELISWIRFFGSAMAIYLVFTSVAFILFFVPSESMQPGLQVGDRFVVSKWAYGWSRESIPFGIGHILPKSKGRFFFRAPLRGDVVVFTNPKNKMVMVKRVVGLPGDIIETRGGRLYLNGEQVKRTFLGLVQYRDQYGYIRSAQSYSEKIGTQRKRAHRIYEFSDTYGQSGWSPDRAGPFLVEAGNFFVMGDNRDNSNDSRSPTGPGQVPMENLIGKAEFVLFTLAKCKQEKGLDCPPSRLWRWM
ncbi:Signal peptidase I [hydrothermal vent metagenome]|uniref:signal peptidase I n=1 Tax=hydrothermal vent metagenome TaxID=652676 RepID=A0A3B0RIB8_9ZZZZ